MSIGMTWFERQGLAELGYGFLGVTELLQGNGKVVVRLCIFRIELQRLPVTGGGFVQATTRSLRRAMNIVQNRHVREFLEHGPCFVLDLFELPLLEQRDQRVDR